MRGSEKYRKMQKLLDEKGIHTTIVKQDKKSFAFIINFETVGVFKKRDTINKRIIKLFSIYESR